MTNDWVDVKNSDCVLVIGANPAENHPASMGWVNEARDKNGAKLIVVDPRFTRTAATADFYASLRSGTDIVFLGGLINYTLENKLYNEEYIRYYTNALTLINPDFKGPADLDGLFSGYDAEKRAYDTKSWQYQTETKTVTVTEKDPQTARTAGEKQVTVPKQAESLDDPNCVFAHSQEALRALHAGDGGEDMRDAQGGLPEGGGDVLRRPALRLDKTGTIFYAMGQTQHTVGTQNVRSMAILQLLLGNIGMPGGGIIALRGESNVQGSTDMGLLFDNLPGYLGAPNDKESDFETYTKRFSKTSYWSNGPAFFKSLMKAWYGDAANADNNYAYDYLPKSSGDYSWISLFEAMYAGKIKGLVCMGQNPAVGGPNARFERKALENLDWLVAMDLFETETASFWRGPDVDPSRHSDRGLPAACRRRHREGRQHRHQRSPHAVAAQGGRGARRGQGGHLDPHATCQALKEAYKASTDAKDRPILDLVWDYGDPPDVELVAREINGYRRRRREGCDRQGAGEEGRLAGRLRQDRQRRRPDDDRLRLLDIHRLLLPHG